MAEIARLVNPDMGDEQLRGIALDLTRAWDESGGDSAPDALAADAALATRPGRFGCPPLPAARTVAVAALPHLGLGAFDSTDVIQPHRRAGSGLRVPDRRWLAWTFSPATESEVRGMIATGRAHARAWKKTVPRDH